MNIAAIIKELRQKINSIERRINYLSAGAGEINTGANIGVAGVGPYNGKVGVQLQFRNIAPGSAIVDVSLDAVNHEIEIDVDPSQIDLGDLGDVNNAAPNDGDVLTWDDGAAEWAPEPSGGGPGGGGGSIFAYRRIGFLYCAGHHFYPSNLTSIAPSQDYIQLAPFFVDGSDQTFDQIGVYVITGRTNGVCKLAVYDDDGNNYPNNLLYETQNLDATAAGAKSENISISGGLVLSPGLYWLGLNSDGDSTITFRALSYSYQIPSIFQFSAYTDIVTYKTWQLGQAFGAFPDPFTAGATLEQSRTIPAVMLRKA